MLSTDFDVETLKMTGFDDLDLSKIFDDNITLTNDEWDNQEEIKKIKKTSVKVGDIYQLGRHRLICGSSLEKKNVDKLMDGVKVDMINTDLPYNINLSYDKGVGNKQSYGGQMNDNKSDEEYRDFVKTIMQNALSVINKNAHVIFWGDERYVWLLEILYKELGIDSKRLLVYVKNNSSPTPTVAFNKATEYAVYGTVGSPYLSKNFMNLNEIQNYEMTTGNNLHTEITNNLMLTKRLPSDQYEHPTEKNPELHYKAIKRCTKIGDVVLDLTAGTGSILMACEKLNRTAYLSEIEPVFCQVIINHYEKLTGQKAKLIKRDEETKS
jgi:DNA modification methylase